MSERANRAAGLHQSGFNCCQSVVGAFCDKYGIDEETAMKFNGGFGGGLRCGEVCGAVSGAVMAIGLKYAQTAAGDSEAKERCYRVTSEFMEKYAAKKGTVLCRELLGYDIRDPDARAKFPGRQKEICPGAIKDAVELLEEMGF